MECYYLLLKMMKSFLHGVWKMIRILLLFLWLMVKTGLFVVWSIGRNIVYTCYLMTYPTMQRVFNQAPAPSSREPLPENGQERFRYENSPAQSHEQDENVEPERDPQESCKGEKSRAQFEPMLSGAISSSAPPNLVHDGNVNSSESTSYESFCSDHESGIPLNPKCGRPENEQSILSSTQVTALEGSTMYSIRKERKPPAYNGEGDLEDYLVYFHTIGLSNNGTEPQFALNLSINLEDMAQQVWLDENGYGPNRLSYAELVATLRKHFSPAGQEKAFRSQFRLRCKAKDESYLAYGQALRRLARRAFPGMTPREQEKQAVEQFVSGLDPTMREKLNIFIASATSFSKEIEMHDVETFAYGIELSTNWSC